MPPQVQAPADGLQRYTKWTDVPDGLYTRTQLRQMTPSRVPGPDAQPVAQALYMGNRYADLYRLDEAVERRTGSPAQVAAAHRARELQYVCRWCDYTAEDEPLGKGRLCNRCRGVVRAYGQHLTVPRHLPMVAALQDGKPVRGVAVAARLETGPAGQELPTHLAVVQLSDLEVLLDTRADPWAQIGPYTYPTVRQRLDEVCGPHSYVHCHGDRGRPDVVTWGDVPLDRLVLPARPPTEPLPYQQLAGYGWIWSNIHLSYYYAQWHHKPGRYDGGYWSPDLQVPLPGGGGAEPVDEALAIAHLVHQLADGTAPVHPQAPWLAAHVPPHELGPLARRWHG